MERPSKLLTLPARTVRFTTNALILCGLAVLTVLGLSAGYRLIRADVRSELYRQKLDALSEDYEALRRSFNEVVKRTAVTELLVENGVLTVRVMDATGRTRDIVTPYDPTREVYIDYVVRDGRLLIRRVFDENTPPGSATVIDADLARIDYTAGWPTEPPIGAPISSAGGPGHARGPSSATSGSGSLQSGSLNTPAPPALYGKAVYRTLGEGRWIVSVTGDGSLGLTRAADNRHAVLVSAPRVRDYEQSDAGAEELTDRITVFDAIRRLVRGEEQAP